MSEISVFFLLLQKTKKETETALWVCQPIYTQYCLPRGADIWEFLILGVAELICIPREFLIHVAEPPSISNIQ